MAFWLRHPRTGTPQGGVISPLLANIYLHEVLDRWFSEDVEPRMRGRAFMIRYADDAVLCFEHEDDARRVMDVLPKRFGRFGLTLHPDKTRLLDFRSPRRGGPGGKNGGPRGPRSFDALGFSFRWERSRKGRWVVKHKTSSVRLRQVVKRLSQWCRVHRHESVAIQHAALVQKLRGHDGYYGVIGNYDALRRLRLLVERAWQKWLNRRSHRPSMTWEKFRHLRERYPLPAARNTHQV